MNSNANPSLKKQTPDLPDSTKKPVRRIASDSLFLGDSRLIITHGGQDYCLLITRNSKLILTK